MVKLVELLELYAYLGLRFMVKLFECDMVQFRVYGCDLLKNLGFMVNCLNCLKI